MSQEELEIKKKKDKAQKCKVIALHSMGKHPTTHTGDLRGSEKKDLIRRVQELFEKDDESIEKEFNSIVCDVLLDHDADYSKYPVYKS